MKKIICLFLALCLVFLSGCASKKGMDDVKLSPVMQEYIDAIDEFDVPVREYGEPKSQTFFSEKLMVGVFYPHVGIAEMDKAMEDWIMKIIGDYQVDTSEIESGSHSAELTVDYRSHLVNDKYVSVKLSGVHMTPYMAHPIEITATFNGDIETGKILTLDDVLSSFGKEKVKAMIIDKENIEINSYFTDEGILDNWMIKENGLDFVLPQGEFLPMSDGTKTVSFSYDELRDFLIIESRDSEEATEEQTTAAEKQEPTDKNSVDEDKDKKPDKNAPMIALTFDDGPSAHTDRLLDILKKYGSKGTFFVVGNMIDNRITTTKRIVNDGHEIASHSWSHRQFTNLSEAELKDQIMTTRAKIYDVTGVDTRLVRPPYGAVNDDVRALASELDVVMVNWSVDTLDWKHKDADKVYKLIMQKAEDGAIILCHDLHKTTVDAMEKAIPALVKKGYQLVTVSELLESKGNTLAAGKVYYKG